MKKNVLLLFVMIVMSFNTIDCFVYAKTAESISSEPEYYAISKVGIYTATLHHNNSISVEHTINITHDVGETSFSEAHAHTEDFSNMPYIKEDSFMIPVKQSVDAEIKFREIMQKEYSNMTKEQSISLAENHCKEIAEREKQTNTQQSIFVKNKENNTVTISFQGNNIIFYKDKKEAFVNGYHMGLYALPDITDNDVYLCEKDFNSIFGCSCYYNKNKEKAITWTFDSYGENNYILARHCEPIIHQETFRISTEYGGTLFYKNNYGNKENEKSIRVYEKNNHMMIAINDISLLKENNQNMETKWNSQNGTVILQFWYDMAKDIVFTKDNNKMLVNGTQIEMEEAAEIKDNRMYIPITALFEILEIPEQNIVWLEQGKNVKITYGKNRKSWAI